MDSDTLGISLLMIKAIDPRENSSFSKIYAIGLRELLNFHRSFRARNKALDDPGQYLIIRRQQIETLAKSTNLTVEK